VYSLILVWLSGVVERLVRTHRVVVFARGSAEGGSCVITARLAHLLVTRGVDFRTISVEDPELRAAVEAHSGWPSFPLVYLDGELIGGLQAVEELADSGGLPCGEPRGAPLVIVRPGPGPANDVTAEPRAEIRMREKARVIVEGAIVSDALPQVLILPRLEKLAPRALMSLAESGATLLIVDARPAAERSVARLRGSIPLERWPLTRVREGAKVVFYSNMEERALDAARLVRGVEVLYVLAGGLTAWLRDMGTRGLVAGEEADDPPPSSPRGGHRDAVIFAVAPAASGVRRAGGEG
jgi:glutaredoxin-related protein